MNVNEVRVWHLEMAQECGQGEEDQRAFHLSAAKALRNLGYVAICTETNEEIWGYGATRKEAKTKLWQEVNAYLTQRDAPETQDYSAAQLERYFGGATILPLRKGGGSLCD